MDNRNIEYKFSILFITLSIIVTIPFIFFLSIFLYGIYIVIENPSFILVGLISISVFLVFILLEIIPKTIKYLKFYLKNEPALILTKNEIIDNINNVKISWNDVREVSLRDLQFKSTNKTIQIDLNNSEKYINNISSPYKRLITKINKNYFFGAFSINPKIIKCNNSELFGTIKECLENYKNLK